MNKQKFINYTKEIWQPYYEEEVTDLDAAEITNNMVDFMNLLIQWDKEDREAENNLARLSVVDNHRSNSNEKELQNKHH